ncbi:hypothetical protein AeRB84_011711 [Aphanomyces euteiches]|nr:hypothetical protein AeRB84_011711 [Aphanomyces euteiches]
MENSSKTASPKRRTAPPREARNNVSYNESFQPYMETFHRSPKRAKPDVPHRRQALETGPENDELKDKLEIGDCVLVSSNDEEYVALVLNLHNSGGPKKFTALWFYRAEDISKDVLAKVDGGVLENEVFQSSERDTNSVEHVVGKCQVISELDFRDRQNIFRLGQLFDEEEPIFVCRYKYDAKALTFQPIKEPTEIRLGLGVNEPNVGDEFQAQTLPPCTKPPLGPFRGKLMWSPSTVSTEPYAFKKFLRAIDDFRFSTGSIVKYYHKYPEGSLVTGSHCRGVICSAVDNDNVKILPAAGDKVVVVLKSDLCSGLTDDRALMHFHAKRRNYVEAINQCIQEFTQLQVEEKKLFQKELQTHLTKNSTATSN